MSTRDGEWVHVPTEEEWDVYSRRILIPVCDETCSLLDRWARPRGEAHPIVRLLDQRHDIQPEELLTRLAATVTGLAAGNQLHSGLRLDLEEQFVE